MSRTISLENWDRLQHYKDRDPPWVKLYRDLLTSESWVLGTDISRLVQVASTLLAARYRNLIPYDFRLIRKVTSLDCTEAEFDQAIAHLSAHKFLKVNEISEEKPTRYHVASTPLATCTSETEQRRGREEQSRVERARELVPTGMVSRETDPDALERWLAVKAKYPSGAARENWVAAEKAARQLVADQHATWEDLSEAVERYQRLCRATNRIVMNPVNFFTAGDRPWAQRWPMPATKAESQQSANVDASLAWLREQEARDAAG